MITEGELREDARVLAKSWWIFLITGILSLVFAFIVLSFDYSTVWAIALFAGFMFLGIGLSELLAAAIVDRNKWVHVLMGVIAFGAGIACFVWPEATFVVLAAILAWFLLFRGILDIVVSLMTRGEHEMWWLQLVVGIAEVLIGFWAISYEGRSFVLLAVWVGAAALTKGVIDLVLAFRLRGFGKDLDRSASA